MCVCVWIGLFLLNPFTLSPLMNAKWADDSIMYLQK